MSSKTVLVTDYTWPSTEPEARVLAEVGASLLIAETGEEEELVQLVPEAHGILTCFKHVTENVIRAGVNLEVIGRYGIGVDNIDVGEATRLEIPVTNVPAYCLDEVAEHTMAFLLSSARGICRYNSAVREGNWDLGVGMPLYRIRGRTLGILGFGKIGQSLARAAAGFGMRITAYDPYLDDAFIVEKGAEPLALDDLIAESDFISLHLPLVPETEGVIDEDRLRRMKPTAFLLNAARGGIIDLEALEVALREGWIAGAALDVFVPERLPADHPLLALPNLIATPHVAFYSEESVLELQIKASENVAAVLAGKRPESIVNPDVLKCPRWAHLAL